jgi:CRP-like cAMP-binding protein
MIRLGAARQLSDAEHHFVFAGNRTVAKRWKLLGASLRSSVTWVEIGYGVLWTLALSYFFGVLAEVPPWKLAFWQTQGLRLGLAVAGSLAGLGLVYLGWETYVFLRDRARARRASFRLWRQRWFGRDKVATDESARLRAVLQAPPFRLLPPPVQQALAKSFKPFQAGPWKVLHPAGEAVSHVSLILSGQVGVYRQSRTGRRLLVQVLCENDLAGLHAIADPGRPDYVYRTLTPVLLLRVDWAEAEKHILPRVPPVVLASQVQKIPFLLRIDLCQNWHKQAIQRFAELSLIRDYREGEVILEHGFFSDSFYIVFESEADVIAGGRRVATIGGSSFFGEIGLLQNSNATARVQARDGARCLCIPRKEFLRFVAHNHTVALELERVSSKRLGRPIFPLSVGNFKQL